MRERFADIPTADGRIDTFVTYPDEGGPFPAVIVLMDIWGLREELFDVARRVATVGYHVTVPNFFYRHGKVRFEYRDDKGRMCRHVLYSLALGTYQRQIEGVACREPDGSWSHSG